MAVGAVYQAMERRQFGASDGIVVITDDFRPLAEAWAGSGPKVATIENWGTLGEIWPGARDNAFAREYGLADGFNFLYSGTLGLKHDPEFLIRNSGIRNARKAKNALPDHVAAPGANWPSPRANGPSGTSSHCGAFTSNGTRTLRSSCGFIPT